jgi:hypothetical protein
MKKLSAAIISCCEPLPQSRWQFAFRKRSLPHHWCLVLHVSTDIGHLQVSLELLCLRPELSLETRSVHIPLMQGRIQSQAVPARGRGGRQGCELLGIPHCPDKWLTDDGKIASPTHRPLSTPQERYFSFLLETE